MYGTDHVSHQLGRPILPEYESFILTSIQQLEQLTA